MPLRSRVLTGVAVAVATSVVTSCGLMGARSDDAPPSSWGLEKSSLRVGRLALVDAAPLHIAMEKGYFAAEGLTIELSTMARGSDSIDQLIAPKPGLDIGLTSYPNALVPQAKGIAKLKVVADAAQTTPDFVLAVVKKDGPITQARQLSGQKIAVSSKRGISELVMTDQLTMMGIDPKNVSFVSMGITDMPAALGRGDVAAAVIAQPSLELAKKEGATKLLDPFVGPEADFPWSGWLASEKFVTENPKTIDAFRRALARGVADAADRNLVEQAATKYLSVDAKVAALMTLPTYPSSEDAKRLQRVADLMARLGEIPKRPAAVQNERLAELDVSSMILPPPAAAPSSQPSSPAMATTSSK